MKNATRLSFDISIHEHAMLKAACAEAMIPMKDFLHGLVVRGIQELREKRAESNLTEISTYNHKNLPNKNSIAESVENEVVAHE